MLDGHVLKQAVGDVVPLQLLLGSSKHPLDRVERRSVLRDGERQQLSLFEELLDGVMLVDACIVEQEHELLSHELPFVLVEFLKSVLKVDEKHEPFSGPVRAHPHLAEVHALVGHGADGGGGGPVRELIDGVVVPLLDPGVEFEGSGVE